MSSPGSAVSHVPNKINDLLILKATKRFNRIHGEVHEYLRNKVFNSNEYFLKASQIAGGRQESASAVYAEPVWRVRRRALDQGQDILVLQLGEFSAPAGAGVYNQRSDCRGKEWRLHRSHRPGRQSDYHL